MRFQLMAVDGIEDDWEAGPQIQLRNRLAGVRKVFVRLRQRDNGGKKRVAGRQHPAVHGKETLAGIFKRIDGVGIEWDHSTNIRDHDVNALREMNLAGISAQKMD